MKSTTGGQHSFAKISHADIPRSSFNRNCGLKTTFDAGYLIPVFCDEALPGDTMNLRMHNFARLATPLHPIMDNMFLDSFFFSVPIRLIWDNWQKFNGEQTDPGDSTDYTIPQVVITDVQSGEVSDYLGLPTEANNDISVSVLWHRAMNLIWNEWFRDQNLQDSIPNNKDDGPDDLADYTLLKRGKRHDYFTACLPWPQKGDSVLLPLGDTAPVIADTTAGIAKPTWHTGVIGNAEDIESSGTGNAQIDPAVGTGGLEWADTKLLTDLSAATSATINQIRQAFQIQKLYERDARGGSRYTEIIRAHFGVTSPDQRLQRPEYLGGGSQPINVTPVPQTSQADTTPQGNLAAFGTSTGSNHSFVKSFDEHCIIIGFVSVRADLNYQQGLPRQFSRLTRWDYYWPALSHLGEQAVLNKEIFARGNEFDDQVFGYQERFAEYRYKQSLITGDFRSEHSESLDTWHLAQDFANLPVLDSQFIEEDPPIARVIAVPTEPHFLFDAYFQFTHARPMPTFSTPGLIDHF